MFLSRIKAKKFINWHSKEISLVSQQLTARHCVNGLLSKLKGASDLSIDKTWQDVQRFLRCNISVLLDYESLIGTCSSRQWIFRIKSRPLLSTSGLAICAFTFLTLRLLCYDNNPSHFTQLTWQIMRITRTWELASCRMWGVLSLFLSQNMLFMQQFNIL